MFSFFSPELSGSDTDSSAFRDMDGQLDPVESFHCVQVLRLKKGASIQVTNGKGLMATGEIIRADPAACLIRYRSAKLVPPSLRLLHLAVAPTKSLDRFEWFLEKATEMGVSKISPLLTQNSERRTLNTERLQKILISAVKQSEQAYLPLLGELQTIEQFTSGHLPVHGFVAHCRPGARTSFTRELAISDAAEWTVLIGPEGDFTETEINDLQSKQYIPISLGDSRLRTETAAVLVSAQFYAINQK